MADIVRSEGICSVSWHFEHHGTRYHLQVALPPGWVLTAPESELRWTPVPTVEVRRRTGDTYRTVERLPIPGATKRHVPVESAEQVARAYQQQIVSPTESSPPREQ